MNASQQELCQEFGLAVFSRAFEPFLHHFKPEDTCDNGRITNSDCTERGLGLDDLGYDCSGLVVASLCETLGIAIADYNPDLRHARQMAGQIPQSSKPTQTGDIVLRISEENAHAFIVVHADDATGGATVVHASSHTNDIITEPLQMSRLNPLHRIQITDLAQQAT